MPRIYMDSLSMSGEVSPETELVFRKALPEDAERIYELYDSLSTEDLYMRFLCIRRPSIDEIRGYLRDPNCIVYIAEHQGRVVAEGFLHRSGEVAVVVHPMFRRRGIARRLSRILYEEAKRNGVRSIFFYTSPDNYPVIKIAKSLGCRLRFSEDLFMGIIDICPERDEDRGAGSRGDSPSL